MDKNLYVIRLDDAVLNKPKYSGLNTNHRPRKPCMAVDALVATSEHVERYRDSHALVFKPALREGRIIYEAA